MPDFSGPIQSLELASWLWLLLFFPLAGALTNAVYCSGLWGRAIGVFSGGDDDTGSPSARVVASRGTVTRIATSSMALSLVTALVYCGVLFQRAPEARFLLRHLWQLIRVGPLDAGFDLAFDPLSAALVVLVTLLATVVCAYAAWSEDSALGAAEAPWRFFACFGAFVFFMLVVLLADNLVLLVFAWDGVGLTGYGLAGFGGAGAKGKAVVETPVRMGAFVVQRAGDAAILVGAALLFWGLGGSWTDGGDYQSDLIARISPVVVTETDSPLPASPHGASTAGKGYLTVTGLADSLVYADDSRTPLLDGAGLPLRTPFIRRELAGAAHSFRISPDDGFRVLDHEKKSGFVIEGGVLPNYSIARQPVGGDHELALAVIGPTLKFRELRDQLLLVDAKGVHTLRDALVTRMLSGGARVNSATGGVLLLTVVCLLLLAGAVLKSGDLPLHGWSSDGSRGPMSVSALIHASGMTLAGVYLIARLHFVFALSHTTSLVVVVVGAGAALYGALASAFQYDVKRVLAYNTLSQLGLAFVALGAGAYEAAIFQVGAHAIVKTCLLLSMGSLVAAMRTAGRDAAASQDLREMGGLGKALPRTASAYQVGCLALTMVPVPLLTGFWPLASIMAHSFASAALPDVLAKGIYVAVIVTAAITSFGMWRSYYLAFAGPARGGKKAVKVTDPSMPTVRILALLAALSAVAGIVFGASAQDLGGERESLLANWLSPVFGNTANAVEVSVGGRLAVVGVGLAVAYVAWASARRRYGEGRPDDWASREASMPGHGIGASSR